MKKYLLPFLLFAIPAPAIAETYNGVQLPANFMIWRGKVYNLDYMANKGIAPVAQPITAQPSAPIATDLQSRYESKETRDNERRVNYENARGRIMIEYLKNVR